MIRGKNGYLVLSLIKELLLFSLVQVQNQSFGPKQNTKFSVNHPPPTTYHLPKTFRRVLGFLWGQDLVCRPYIDQRGISPNFAPLPQIFWPPPPFKFFRTPQFFGRKKDLVRKQMLVWNKNFGPKKKCWFGKNFGLIKKFWSDENILVWIFFYPNQGFGQETILVQKKNLLWQF